MKRHQLPHGEIIHARVEDVYPTIAPRSVTLCHVDGPYGMGKAAWDKVKDLAAWYRPHIAEWGRVCASSASVYLWNTAEGWAAIHPEMVAAGWTLATLIVWDKRTPPSMLGWRNLTEWPDCTEVCGFYKRGAPPFMLAACTGNVWECSVKALSLEMIRTGEMVAHRGSEGDVEAALHPCQKPLSFVRRIIETSSHPGDLVFAPFGGTCREAFACEAIGRYESEKARRYVCVEMDEDGRDYIPAVLASLRGDLPSGRGAMQLGMFGGAA